MFIYLLADMRGLLTGFVITGVLLAEAPPDAAATEKLIAGMRESAAAYDSKLPDFICTQVTHREARREVEQPGGVKTSNSRGASPPGPNVDGNWKPVDWIEQQLTYFGHRETYKIVTINGKKAAPDQVAPGGMSSTGEFGSTLGGIFDPLSQTEFKWKRWDKVRGQPVYVFSFAVAKENSAAALTAGTAHVVAGYHGLIFVERGTHAVVRVTTEAEVPPDFPLQHVTHALDYGRALIGGESYLLPLRSEMESRSTVDFIENGRIGNTGPQVTLRNTIDFKGYRKYGVESALKPE